jgi:hypothetical protein
MVRKFGNSYTSRHAGRHGVPSGQAGAYPLAAGECVRVQCLLRAVMGVCFTPLHVFTPDPAQATASPVTTPASRRPSQEIDTPAYRRPSQAIEGWGRDRRPLEQACGTRSSGHRAGTRFPASAPSRRTGCTPHAKYRVPERKVQGPTPPNAKTAPVTPSARGCARGLRP